MIVYRDRLLPPSETFIPAQAAALRRYRAVFAGSRRVSQVALPGPAIVLNEGGRRGRMREVLFKAAGVAPTFFARLRAERPALLHVHFGVDAAVALPVKRALGVPMVVTFHGYDATTSAHAGPPSSFPERLYRRRIGRIGREADRMLAISGFIREAMVSRGFPREKITVHYTGVDTALFRPTGHPPEGPVVLFVGRLVENKGCEYLVRAMKRVRAAVPGARLVVIGDGPRRQALEAQAGQAVEFLGARSGEGVRHWLARCAVFCVPSVTLADGQSEGLGMVFAEAQACGVPVVSFRTGGIPEVVTDGVTGYLVAERDEAELAERLVRLLGDPVLRERLGRAARERMVASFDLATQTASLERLYDETIEEWR